MSVALGGQFMPICLYCNEEKMEEELSQEHVIPRAIGGNLIPTNPFSLNRVCKRCNSICGTFIDGPFIKNWLTQNNRTEAILKYADITKNPTLPLRYMGSCEDIKFEDNICELWLGPTGDTIYHFHKPYPEEAHVAHMVGVPTFARKDEIDSGFAFLFIRSNNPAWHPTIAYSFISQFKDSILYLGNGPTPKGGRFSDIPLELQELHSMLRSMSGQVHSASIKMNIDYGDRFIAKVALGIGGLFLNKEFLSSKSAQLLRTFMWTRDSKQREKLPLRGTGFWGALSQDLKNIMNWPGGHVIALIQSGKTLNLFTSFYEAQTASIIISSEPQHWDGIVNEGLVFVISPGLQKYVGPKNIANYIAHKYEGDMKDKDFSMLEEEMNNIKEWPPFDI